MQNKKNIAKVTAKYGMLVALACVFSFIEAMIPISIGVPGVKLGLANLVTMIALYSLSLQGTILVSVVRVLLTGAMFGGMSVILYSMAGCTVSLLCMVLAKKTRRFSMVGVSVLGGIGHNLGQMLVAVMVMENTNLWYYFSVLMLAGIIAGSVIGLLGGIILKRLSDFLD